MRPLLHLILFAALGQTGPIEQPKYAAIAGTVQKPGSGIPISDAAVELSPAGNNPGKPYTALTSSEGKFALRDIPPGEYRLAATRPGYMRSEYGQRGPHGSGLGIMLTAGQEMKDANITLTETGAISGRIQNPDGDPVANVQVQALQYTYFNGRRALRTIKGAVTNDLGEYRLYWLPPERYVVMATALQGALPDSLIQALGSDHTLTSRIPSPTGELILSPDDDPPRPFFFPGTTDPKSATTLTVRSGENVRNVDIVIAAPRAWRVRGRVINLPAVDAAGLPEAQTFVRLAPRDPGALFDSTEPLGLHVADMNTGAFEIRGVLPGSYYLDATGDGMSSGRVSFEVVDADVDNVTVPLTPWFDVPVRVGTDRGPANGENPVLDRIVIALDPVGVQGLIAYPVPQQSSGAGAFALRGVSPFDYRISVGRLPESGYVKSIRLDGANILDDEFHLERAPANPIEIVIGVNAGALAGTVVTDKMVSLSNVTVVLVPGAPRRQRWDLYKKAWTDASGAFKFPDVTPGDYKVFAWEDVKDRAWQDPEFIAIHENRGKLVRVDEDSKATIEITAIPVDAR